MSDSTKYPAPRHLDPTQPVVSRSAASDPRGGRPPRAKSRRAPLGMPAGSVRALLTLIIVGVVVVRTIRELPMGLLLAETLMVALAHYFTSRRLVKLPAAVKTQLEAEGLLDRDERPLYLPRNSVRVLIVGAFVGTAAYMAWSERLMAPEALATLGIVLAYFLGLAATGVMEWWAKKHPARDETVVLWEDAKAAVVLLVTVAFAVANLAGAADGLPPWATNATFALILFYFGSR
ncbi:MAG: hypothetical protein WD066_00340 [Planctomycetaceae bacterium]